MVIGFHREMDKFVFDRFVKESKGLEQILLDFNRFYQGFKNQINPFVFDKEYCESYIKERFEKMLLEKPERKLGFMKKKSLKETILMRFSMNNGNIAFLPQKNIASVFGCSQKTVCLHIQKLEREGYLKCSERKHWRWHVEKKQALSYRLLDKGFDFINKLNGKFKQVAAAIRDEVKKVFKQEAIVETTEEEKNANKLRYLSLYQSFILNEMENNKGSTC